MSAVRGVSGLLPTQACPCRKEDGLTTNMMKYRIRNGWVKTAHFRDANQSQNKNISNFELLHLSDGVADCHVRNAVGRVTDILSVGKAASLK